MRKRRRATEQQVTDAALAHRAAAGELAAFEELYRRHVEAAWRLALAVTTNPDDAADAVSDAFTRVLQALPDRPHAADHFLPYLLTAVRNTAIDTLRRGGRHRFTDVDEDRDCPELGGGPAETVLADLDAALVAAAFRSLPERWRSVLWLTEVEGIPARDAAPLLGVSPNGVAQLAVRARAGLRQRYLQAHLGDADVRLLCRDTVERLGAYAAGALAPRDVAKVDQHLAGCELCRSRLTQLEDLAPTLRRSVLPVPAVLAALSVGNWRSGSTATAGADAAVTSAISAPAGIGTAGLGTAAPAVGIGAAVVAAPGPLVTSMASVALFVAGVVGAGTVDRPPPAPAPAAAAPATFGIAASVRHDTGGDPLARLVQKGADVVAGLADVPARLADALPPELTDLAGGTDLDALARGTVRIDAGTTVVDVDVAGGPAGCRDVRVLGVAVACSGPSTAPGGNVTDGAPARALAETAADAATAAADAAAAALDAAAAASPPVTVDLQPRG